MLILNNLRELATLKAQNFSQVNSIKQTYDFSTLYFTIPNDELKHILLDISDKCFLNKNEKRKYSYYYKWSVITTWLR
jgi:hypothetical protein